MGQTVPGGEQMIKETLIASDYFVFETKQSQIDLSAKTHVLVGLRCPKCKRVNKIPEHLQTTRCACGLRMVLKGNALECEMR